MEISSKLKKDSIKLVLANKLKKIIDEWNELYKKHKKITQNNFEELIDKARSIVVNLEEFEPLFNPPADEFDIKILNWTREKKVQYETLAFDIEVIWKRLRSLNDELLMVRIDNEKSRGCLFIICEGIKDKKIAEENMDLFYDLYKKFIYYNDEHGNCDVISLLNYLEEVKTRFSHPFTYALIPEGNKETAEELLRESLGRELNSKKLREIYFLKEIRRSDYFPVFRVKVGERSPNDEIIDKGSFYTDPRYYDNLKEREKLYAK